MNVLLLVVNAIDINWIWFGFKPAPGFDLTQFVHEGTYVLILSILVAMGIVLWFFRRNLNFYEPGLPLLRWGARCGCCKMRCWPCRWGCATTTTFCYTGLGLQAHRGVLLSAADLLWAGHRAAQNLAAPLGLLAGAPECAGGLRADGGAGRGNWEIWIARYNLRPELHELDYGFLLNMPDRVLPVLAAHPEVLTQRHLVHESYSQWIELEPEAAAQQASAAR